MARSNASVNSAAPICQDWTLKGSQRGIPRKSIGKNTLKPPWNILKYPENTLKLPENTLKTPLKTPWKHPENSLKLPENTLKTPWKHPENTLKTPENPEIHEWQSEKVEGATWLGATGLRASGREICLWENLWEGFQRVFRGFWRFSEVCRVFRDL